MQCAQHKCSLAYTHTRLLKKWFGGEKQQKKKKCAREEARTIAQQQHLYNKTNKAHKNKIQ